jgi:hypothetical protein
MHKSVLNEIRALRSVRIRIPYTILVRSETSFEETPPYRYYARYFDLHEHAWALVANITKRTKKILLYLIPYKRTPQVLVHTSSVFALRNITE